MNQELEEKTSRLVNIMEREKLAGVLLNGQPNFSWLTCGSYNGIDTSRENGVTTLLVAADGRRFLLANKIEMPRMLAEEVKAEEFTPVEYAWQDERTIDDLLAKKAAEILGPGTLGSDLPISSTAKAVEKHIAPLRYSLTPPEIERIKILGSDAGRVLRETLNKIRPGETEIAIAARVRYDFWAERMDPVVVLVAADDRIAKFRHPVPTGKRWEKTLMIVVCAKRHGLVVSLTRFVNAGPVAGSLHDITEAAAFVNASVYAATKPGATGAELYKILADAYAKKGSADEIDKHHQGGAAGYKTREWNAHPTSAEVVQPHQAFAWNPSITGTKVEETCIVTENGVEIITASPDFPQISTVIDGREYLSPGILVI